MDKSNKQIMVIETNTLFGGLYFEGFKPENEFDYESRILNNFKYMRRGHINEPTDHSKGNAERDYLHKQPISYAVLVNPDLKQVFAYQRSSEDSKYAEKRLQVKWSWDVGGHIEEVDTENGNQIHSSLLRELGEKVNGVTNQKIKILGYINDDSNSIGKVHFGMLYVIETDSRKVEPNDPEMAEGRFRTIKELGNILASDNEIETWSEIALDPLREYLRKL